VGLCGCDLVESLGIVLLTRKMCMTNRSCWLVMLGLDLSDSVLILTPFTRLLSFNLWTVCLFFLLHQSLQRPRTVVLTVLSFPTDNIFPVYNANTKTVC
jgi:hypothetical protein